MHTISLIQLKVTFICIALFTKTCCDNSYTVSYLNLTTEESSNDILYNVSTTIFTDGLTTEALDYGVRNEESRNKTALYVGAFFPFGGGWDGSSIMVAVNMALDHINDRDDILEGYELRMVYNDTQCQAGLGTRVLFDQLVRKPTKIMLFGDGCSSATQAIAGTSYHWNLVTMSYSASSPALSNRKAYPYFYRVVMPDTGFNPARIEIIKHFGWTRVATLHQNEEVFSLAIDNLLTLLKEANISLVTSESFADNPKNQVANIKKHDAKIIIVNIYANMARKVFCEAYQNQMIDGYAWLFVGWYETGWYLVEDPSIECTVEEMKMVVEGSFYLGFESQHKFTSDVSTSSGLTTAEFEAEIYQRLKLPENQRFQWHNRNPYGYDAMWAVGLVLNQSIETLETLNKTLEEFTYDDEEYPPIFMNILNNMSFNGISGPVSFVGGDRVDTVRIEQFRASCEDGWRDYKGKCYRFITDHLSFTMAMDKCSSHNGNLASVVDEDQLDFLVGTWAQTYPTFPKWYVGLQWDGERLVWTANNQHTINMSWPFPTEDIKISSDRHTCFTVDFTTSNNRWTATNCSDEMPYICEKSQVFVEKLVASYNAKYGGLVWHDEIIWPDNKVPLDHTPEIIITTVMVYEGIDLYLYISMSLLAGIGILLALFFLLFNIYHKKQRVVRMSSPNLNNLILLGGILIYSSIFFDGLDINLVSEHIEELSCQIRVWFFSVGFVVAFGAMFSKTWRVHKIAAFKKPKRTIITDNQLFMMVFALFMVDVIILTAWQIVDPMTITVKTLLERDDPEVENQRMIPYIRTCTSDLEVYWIAPLYAYKGVLLIFGAFLAWETRKVTIPALNDSKLIGISVYNVIILCTIGLSVSFIISDDPSALYIFTSSIIVFCASLTLLIVFVPKIISVVKFPEGEPISTMKNNMPTFNTMDSNTSSQLIKENEELKKTLKQVKSELNDMKQNGCGNSSTTISTNSNVETNGDPAISCKIMMEANSRMEKSTNRL